MMQELIDTLCDEQHTLVVLHEGRIRTFDGQGVRHLYNMINEEPELLYDAKVAVKAVGRSAAAMMVEGGGLRRVYFPAGLRHAERSRHQGQLRKEAQPSGLSQRVEKAWRTGSHSSLNEKAS